MIIQLTITFLVFFAIHLLLRKARRISLIPLYLCLLLRLSYPGVVYSPWSLWQTDNNYYYLMSEKTVMTVWLLGAVLVIGMTVIRSISIIRPNEKIQYRDDLVPQARGFIQPVIVLPKTNNSDNDLILLHEEQHILRKHHWIKLIFQFYCAVYWWHPFIWVVRSILYSDLEIDCDESVVTKLNRADRYRYVNSIIHHASSITSTNSLFGGSSMKFRVLSIIKYKKQSVKFSLMLIVFLGILSIPIISAPISHSINPLPIGLIPRNGELAFQKPTFEPPETESIAMFDQDRVNKLIIEDLTMEKSEWGKYLAEVMDEETHRQNVDVKIAETLAQMDQESGEPIDVEYLKQTITSDMNQFRDHLEKSLAYVIEDLEKTMSAYR